MRDQANAEPLEVRPTELVERELLIPGVDRGRGLVIGRRRGWEYTEALRVAVGDTETVRVARILAKIVLQMRDN